MKNSRRDFLQESAFGASTILLGGAAAVELARPGRLVGANEKIRVAVIGVNGRGGSHIAEYLKSPDTEITVICDCDEKVGNDRADAIAKKQQTKPTFVKDLRQVMDNKSIDAISIATTNHWHALAAIWGIQAGKDVYVEKPVSHNVSEGRRIIEAARKYNKVCQTGTQSRSSDAVREAVALAQSGKLGKLKVARGLCYKPRPSIGKVDGPQAPPPDVDYNLWLGPAPVKPVMRKKFHYDWHWQWDYGNGDLGNQGIHQMDIARRGLGKMELSEDVFTLGGRFGYIDDGETPNTELTIFQYGDQQLIFEVRGLKTPSYPLCQSGVANVFHCENGSVALNSGYSGYVVYDKDGKQIDEYKEKGDSTTKHFQNFIDTVKNRDMKKLSADILEGHLSSALCHLGNISYVLGKGESFTDAAKTLAGKDVLLEALDRTKVHLTDAGVDIDNTKIQVGRPLKVNPKAENFKGDPQADLLLTREYRSPFVVPAAGKV